LVPDLTTNDDWKQLYNAIINAAAVTDTAGIEDSSTVSNALGFDDLPDLIDPYAWLPDAPLTKLGKPWTSLAPSNSPTNPIIRQDLRQSPQHANELTVPPCTEPIQLARDIYETATVTGSNAHRQQWLHQGLRHSLCGSRLSAQDDGRGDPGSTGVPQGVKRPSLNQVAEQAKRTRMKKKPRMQLTRFYCSKCGETSADHQYEQCPTWRTCGYCNKEGHLGFHCPTPHVKCTWYRCGVDVGCHGSKGPWLEVSAVVFFNVLRPPIGVSPGPARPLSLYIDPCS
jgi:hypothetical protein